MADVPSIVIEELQASAIGDGQRRSVELTEHDLPPGREHEIAAFSTGVEIDIGESDNGIINPGSDRVVYPVMGIRYTPMELKGRFLDKFFEPGHARSMRDALMEIAQRANPLKISWNDDERQGLLKKAQFGEESKSSIVYELQFLIATPAQGNISKKVGAARQETFDPNDLIYRIRTAALLHSSALKSIAFQASMQTTLSHGMLSIERAVDVADIATAVFVTSSTAAPHALVNSGRLVQSSCQTLGDALDDQRKLLGTIKPSHLKAETSKSVIGMNVVVQDALTEFLLMTDLNRKVRNRCLKAVQRATRLYRVQPGDTLEYVAMSQLGSKSRSLDLGITQADLIPGAYIRIPERR